jgi:TolB-like protein
VAPSRLRPIMVALIAAVAPVPAVSPALAQTVDTRTATVGVLDFSGVMMSNAGASVSLGKAVSSMLITELVGRPGITVIERQDLRKVLEEQRLALSGVVDESTAIEVGRILGAQYMIFGVATSWSGLRLDMRAVDVETSEILSVEKMQGEDDELLDMVVRIGDRFAETLSLPPLEDRPDFEPVPAMATIEFSRGLDFEDEGDVAEARAAFERALQLYPNHRGARRALERLNQEGGGS